MPLQADRALCQGAHLNDRMWAPGQTSLASLAGLLSADGGLDKPAGSLIAPPTAEDPSTFPSFPYALAMAGPLCKPPLRGRPALGFGPKPLTLAPDPSSGSPSCQGPEGGPHRSLPLHQAPQAPSRVAPMSAHTDHFLPSESPQLPLPATPWELSGALHAVW